VKRSLQLLGLLLLVQVAACRDRNAPVPSAGAGRYLVGMSSMVMGFGVGSGLPLAGLAPGDQVEVTFTVDWERPALTVERLVRLPPGTHLTFGEPAR